MEEPNLYRDMFNYEEIPKCAFNHRLVPMYSPEEIWITDTTFRDGQQSRAPYTVDQILTLYDYMHRLGGPKGKIRQCEFFLYSDRDKEAVRKCQERGYDFPEITGWIRATKKDFELVKEMGLKECGILVSCSDYHIFKKLNKTRKEAMEGYLDIIKAAIDYGIRPRCHFEDITRADFYGFVVPFATELRKLMEESGIPIKIRACDTLGYGLNYPGVALPRSVSGNNIRSETPCGIPKRTFGVARPQRLLQSGRQLHNCLALRCIERELFSAWNRREDRKHSFGGNGYRIRSAARNA